MNEKKDKNYGDGFNKQMDTFKRPATYDNGTTGTDIDLKQSGSLIQQYEVNYHLPIVDISFLK